jgi:iron complex outermembrane recepter protein
LNTNAAFDDTFSADWVTDLSVSYKFKQFTATIGAENITDEYPDEVTTVLVPDANGFLNSGVGDNSFAGILPYARGEAPYGFNGRFVYVKLGYSW